MAAAREAPQIPKIEMEGTVRYADELNMDFNAGDPITAEPVLALETERESIRSMLPPRRLG